MGMKMCKTNTNMNAKTARNITDVLKAFQLLVAITILGLTAHLVQRYQHLVDQCPPDPQGHPQGLNCQNEGFVLGAMKYSLVPPILAICDTIIWVVDSYLTGLPYTFIIWSGWIVQGFYMGGGCTLASRLDGGWKCQNNNDGQAGARLCDEFFADVGLMFVGVLTSWSMIWFLYRLSSYYPRGMTTDSTDYRNQRETEEK